MDIRTYREKWGPIEAAAKALRVTHGYLSQLERGLKWPGPFIIRKISLWSKGAVTAQDFFDNLDWHRFAKKPVRVGGRPRRRRNHHGESNGKAKKSAVKKGRDGHGRRRR